jgi:iron complex outermembrane receptor protein
VDTKRNYIRSPCELTGAILKKQLVVKKSVLAVALTIAAGSSLIGGYAQAQDAPAVRAEEEKNNPATPAATPIATVYVTGSNIRRISAETASPVQVITRDELVRGGATSLTEVLKTISSNVGGINENRSNGFSSGASSMNLRGIGSQATLMLINGRRLAPYAQPEFQTTFVDLNSVPIGAVDRIEILKDGASAIYGSEAIAGVVNIIMKDSFEGVQLESSIGESAVHDGRLTRATVTAGFGSLVENHFNAYAALDVRQIKPTYLNKREGYLGTLDLREWGYRDRRSLYTFPGNIYWTDKATNKVVSRTLDQNCPADRLVPATRLLGANAIGNACVFDDLKDGDYNGSGDSDRIGLTSRVTWQPNASTTVFAELMAHQNKSRLTGLYNWVAGQPGQPTPDLPITHPQYPQELIDPVTGKTLAGGTGQVRVRASLKDFPGQGQDNTTDFGRYLVGAKGELGNWSWETAALASTSKVTSVATSAILTKPFVDAYKNGTFIFGNTAGNADLYNRMLTSSTDSFKSSLYQIDAKLAGELFNLPAGAVSVAAGVEARREKLVTNPDERAVAGELYHLAQSPPGFENDRSIKSVFAEMTIPVLKSLEAQLAVRHDRYSDYGKSTTPKLGLKWTVSPSIIVRSTYSEGFRAPTLVENSTDIRHAFLSFEDPARCNAQFKTGCRAQSPYDSGANPALAPETAKSYTLGLGLEPTKWLVATVDAWRIRRDNEIGTYSLTRVLDDPARYANDPAVAIVRDPLTAADQAAGATAGEVTLIKMLLTNVAVTDVRGVDLDLRGKFNMGEYGRLEPRLQVAYMRSYKNAPSPDDPQIEYIKTRGAPSYQGTFGVAWKKAQWQLSADAVYVGKMGSYDDFSVDCGFENEGYPELCRRLPSFTTINLGGSYKGFLGMKDLKLGFAIQNAFDRKPPFNPYTSSLGFYQPLHNVMGRFFQISAEYRFK